MTPALARRALLLGVLALLFCAPAAAQASPPALYVSDEANDLVYQYDVDPGTGALTAMTPTDSVGSSDGPVRLATSPDTGSGAFLYATGINDGVVAQYEIDGTTGELTAVGAGPDAGVSAGGIAVAPEGGFAYVVELNGALGRVRKYAITATGALSFVSDEITATEVRSIAMTADGRSLYAGLADGTIEQYDVDATTGALSLKSPASVDTGGGDPVVDMRPGHLGDRLYAVTGTGDLFAYAVGGAGGQLAAASQESAACAASGLATTTDFPVAIYVACPGDNEIVQFSEEFQQLQPLGSPVASTGVRQLTARPDRSNVYAARTASIDQHRPGVDGALGAAAPTAEPGAQFSDVALAPANPLAAPTAEIATFGVDEDEPAALDGQASSGTDRVETYEWEYENGPASGAFERDPSRSSSIAPVFTAPGTYDVRLTARARQVYDGRGTQQYAAPSTPDVEPIVIRTPDPPPTAGPSAPGVYVAGGNDVAQFGEAADGRLVPKSPPTVAGGSSIMSAAASPDGTRLYVLNGAPSNSISTFAIAADGRLTALGGTVATGGFPRYVAVAPDGRSLYVTSNTTTAVHQYSLTANGTPTPKSPASVDLPGATTARGLAVTSDGAALFAAAQNGVHRFAIASDGRLSALGTVAGPLEPEALRISPDGESLYLVDFGSRVWQYTIGSGGSLAPKTPPSVLFPRTCQPFGGTPSVDGADFYAGCVNPGGVTRDVAHWEVDADGALMMPAAFTVLGTFGVPELTPNPGGTTVYAASVTSRQLAVDPGDGSLTPASPGVLPGDRSGAAIVVRPRQTVEAGFTATPAAAGSPTRFDASPSSASGGASIARYDWDFGDGSTAPNGGPSPSHTYAAPGTYTPRLTVTADNGSRTVFMGTSMLRRGSDTEGAALTVPPPGAPPPAPVSTPPAPSGPVPSFQQPPPVAPPPVLGESVQARPVRGAVLVRVPGGRFVALETLRTIPVGSVVDATRGRARITVEARGDGRLETCDFYDGVFRITQPREARPVTNAQLLAPTAGARAVPRARAAQSRRKRSRSRKLWGDGKGRFRSTAKHSAATVRGTRWLIQETAAGSLTRVTRGSVSVRDFGRRRTVIVRAGGRYTARPRR